MKRTAVKSRESANVTLAHLNAKSKGNYPKRYTLEKNLMTRLLNKAKRKLVTRIEFFDGDFTVNWNTAELVFGEVTRVYARTPKNIKKKLDDSMREKITGLFSLPVRAEVDAEDFRMTVSLSKHSDYACRLVGVNDKIHAYCISIPDLHTLMKRQECGFDFAFSLNQDALLDFLTGLKGTVKIGFECYGSKYSGVRIITSNIGLYSEDRDAVIAPIQQYNEMFKAIDKVKGLDNETHNV